MYTKLWSSWSTGTPQQNYVITYWGQSDPDKKIGRFSNCWSHSVQLCCKLIWQCDYYAPKYWFYALLNVCFNMETTSNNVQTNLHIYIYGPTFLSTRILDSCIQLGEHTYILIDHTTSWQSARFLIAFVSVNLLTLPPYWTMCSSQSSV